MRRAILALVTACGGSTAPAPAAPTAAAPTAAVAYVAPPLRTCGGPAPASGPTTIRDVDFCNRAYPSRIDLPGPDDDTAVQVVGGEFEERVYFDLPGCDYRHTTELWRVRDVAYGDLDGDGVEDAAVTIDESWFSCTSDPDHDERTTRIRAYTLRGGQVVPLGDYLVALADDRWLGAATELAIAGSVVIRTLHWKDGTTCTDHFRLDQRAGDLEQLGPPCT